MLFLPKMAASFCNLVGLLQHNTRIFSALPLKNNLSFASWIRLKAWVILNIMTDWVTFYLSRISFCAMHKECVSHSVWKVFELQNQEPACLFQCSLSTHMLLFEYWGRGGQIHHWCNCFSISKVFQRVSNLLGSALSTNSVYIKTPHISRWNFWHMAKLGLFCCATLIKLN